MVFFAWLLIITGTIGFGLAAYWDLKTTEFPEWLPYSMIAAALAIHGAAAVVFSDMWIFLSSLTMGFVFLGLGLLLYYSKQWGDGDAWLLGVAGFVFPSAELFQGLFPGLGAMILPLPVAILMNFFLIALVYLIAYSLYLGFRSPKQSKEFIRELRENSTVFLILTTASLAASLVLAYYGNLLSIGGFRMLPIIIIPLLIPPLVLFFRYGRFVEKNLFRKKISVNHLKKGDVISDNRWRGVTVEEINRLKKSGRTVEIKEGVRFAPVFIITMLITLLLGNLAFLFI